MPTVFFKGVVVDVLNSTSDVSVTNQSINDHKSLITTEAMKNFPRNTVIVKTISEGAAKRSGIKVVCYPFFSSHLCMPLKLGEYVWFIYENTDNRGSLAYWLSRVSEPDHVEDVNYAFASRTYTQPTKKPEKKASDKFEGVSAESDEVQTYSWESPTADPLEMAKLIEVSQKINRFESVPRYTKRQGDLVLQGSNNSLIMLGEERGHWAPNQFLVSSANTPADGIQPGQPAIDIVVGRGSKSDESSKAKLSLGNYGITKGKTIKNEFGLQELDKRNKLSMEGDPHFSVDATRVYLTANSNNINSSYHPDKLLGVSLPDAPGRSQPVGSEPGAFAVIKSDNLRLVAREAGSIRVIKEPTNGSTNGAAIMMFNDGEMQLAANRLNLTSYQTDGATQPYVRYQELMSLLNSLLDDINTFCTTLATHVTPGFGAPSPQILAAALTLQTSTIQKKALLALGQVLVNGTPQNIGSVVIYGE